MFDTKEDLQQVCEAVLHYQKGLEEIEKYIVQLNSYVAELNDKLRQKEIGKAFGEYGAQLQMMHAEMDKLEERYHAIQNGQYGVHSQVRILSRFSYAVRNFENAMKDFNQRADSLSQKLYNKDFNNALKAMNAIAEDSKLSGTYEYRHVTDHDYEILKHEYEQSLQNAQQKKVVSNYLQACADILLQTRLRRPEYESLQRLTEKMVHSDSKALQKFIEEVVTKTSVRTKKTDKPANAENKH